MRGFVSARYRPGRYKAERGCCYLQICPECGISEGAGEETLSDGARLARRHAGIRARRECEGCKERKPVLSASGLVERTEFGDVLRV